MEVTHALLARLERIEALDREGAPAERLLPELRELVREAEAWARTEHDARAEAAARACAAACEGLVGDTAVTGDAIVRA